MTGQVSAEWRRWTEAAKILAVDPKAAVACPACGKGTLLVIDSRYGTDKIDRHMQCPVCYARNVLSLTAPTQG